MNEIFFSVSLVKLVFLYSDCKGKGFFFGSSIVFLTLVCTSEDRVL